MTLRTVASALLLLTLGGLAAFAMAALGGGFSDRLDVLTHFAPLTAAGALVATLLALLISRGGSRLAAAALGSAAVAASGALIAPELIAAGRSEPAAPAGAERLRVLQFNVLRRNGDPAATAAVIRALSPDVVVLEEVNGAAAVIPDLLRIGYPHQVGCGDPRPCGTRVLSRRAPLASGGLQAPHDRDGSVNAAWMTLPLRSGARTTVVGTHYTWPFPGGPQQAQMRALDVLVRRFPSDTLIVAGDMNSTPWSYTLRRQDRALGLERRTRALFSWPEASGRLPLLPIDHLYAGSGWRTVAVGRGPRTASDHYPVVVDLAHAPS